jgi:phenylalanyl-tRNA synthetase beta chain
VQDIAVVVQSNVSAFSVEAALREGAGELLESITLFDRYDKLEDGNISLAYSMVFRAPDRTLTADEVSGYREAAAAKAAAQCGATVRS